jgi:hypothetical protein
MVSRIHITGASGAGVTTLGGARHEEHEAFISWAMAYDIGPKEGRSLARHEAWLKALACPVLRLDGSEPTDKLLRRVLAFGHEEADPNDLGRQRGQRLS